MHEDCREYFEKISEYLDKELDDDILYEKIADHLRECPACRDCFDSLRKTIDLCRRASRTKMPAEAKIRLKATLTQIMSDRY